MDYSLYRVFTNIKRGDIIDRDSILFLDFLEYCKDNNLSHTDYWDFYGSPKVGDRCYNGSWVTQLFDDGSFEVLDSYSTPNRVKDLPSRPEFRDLDYKEANNCKHNYIKSFSYKNKLWCTKCGEFTEDEK